MTMIFLPEPIYPGAPVAFDVALDTGVLRVAGTVERASVQPCEREDAA